MEYRLSVELSGHFGVVRHVEAIPGAIFASSSRDCTSRVWKLVDNKEWGLLNLLNPHQQLADKSGIAATHYIPAGVPGYDAGALVTVAYDHTAVVQNVETSEVFHRLIGHNDAVVCCTHTPNGDIITGSADKTIIVWRNGRQFKQLSAHATIVWALACLPNGWVVSGSADKSIKIWDTDYKCVKTINTNSYIRGLSVVPEVGFLSCGSNESLQLWSYDGELLYDLRGHKDTVYSATSLPTGEIVSASEDCSVIIWNGTEASQSLATPSGVWSVTALDNGDIIAACQDKMIRVFTRDASRFISDELLAKYTEDVMAAAAAAEAAQPQRQSVNGVEYDHIIQVDLAEGQPTIPLGYNENEQAVDAAERFITQNNISPMYLDQITQFISNAMGERRFTQGQATQGPYIDPFRDTAVPAQFGTNLVPSSVPQGSGRSQQSAPRQGPTATAPAKKEAFPIIPPIIVEAGQSAQILTKLKQLNDQFTPEEAAYVLTEAELKAFDTLGAKISPSTLGSQTAYFSQAEVKVVQQALQKWPASKRFPILDLARLAILYPDFANQSRETLLPIVKADLESVDSPLSQLMALRVFVNAFKWKILHTSLESLAESVLENLSSLISSTANANIPSLAVSLLRNYATQLSTTKSEARIQILSIALEDILLNDTAAPSIVYLGLYSIGSLISRDAQLILTAQGMGIQDATQVYAESADANVKEAATGIATLFSSGVGQ